MILSRHYEDHVVSSTELRWAIVEANKPLLDKIDDLIAKINAYHENDIEFQRKFLLLLSKMLRNQQISMEAFDELDSFIQKECFWNKSRSKQDTNSADR